MARNLSADRKVPNNRLALIEHGIDGDRFAPMEPAQWPTGMEGLDGYMVVSYIGTLGKAHGLETLLEAAQRIASEDPRLQFLLVGDGAEKSRLMALAKSRSLKNVRFLPAQPWENIPSCINRSAICVALLNPAEIFQTVMPTKVLEYLACGKPVVLAAEGHSRQVLEAAHGGLTVDPGDAQALSEAILKLARDPELRRRCGEEGRRYVLQRFCLDSQAETYLRLLQERVRAGSKTPRGRAGRSCQPRKARGGGVS